jgi:2-polyprenyl-3-methyl-5-hydroxy-6-metoxy-1,4-benzoquinol methylase
VTSLVEYWDQRARDFAADGAGLRAVCSYGMPSYYNGYIHLTQRLALAPYLRVERGTTALDIGCGIGRWSRILAARGASVTAIDVAPSMIEEARRRTPDGTAIEYGVADVRTLSLGTRFDLVLAVTVLQHILDDGEFRIAIDNIARHVTDRGRIVLLEAAPTQPNASCNTAVFRARTAGQMTRAFADAGLRVIGVSGVDPAPWKQKVLPRYRSLPRAAAHSALFAATALSLPYDALFGRMLTARSWHKVFLLERDA